MRFGPAGLAIATDAILTPLLTEWHTADDYTAELRVRPDALSQGFPLQSDYAYAGIGDGQQKIAFLAVTPSGTPNVRVGFGGSYTSVASSVALPPNPGDSSHLACVVEGTAIRLFLDGELVGSGTRGGATTKTLAPVRIGQRDGTFHYRGWVRDVRLWKVARTQQQIRDGMRDGIRGDEFGLVAWWPLEVDAKDYSRRPRPATVIETFNQVDGQRRFTDSGHRWAYLYNEANVNDANGFCVVENGQMAIPGAYGSHFLYVPGSNNRRMAFTVKAWPANVVMAQMRMSPASGGTSIQFNAGNVTAYDDTGSLGTVTIARPPVGTRVTTEVDGFRLRAWYDDVLVGTWMIKSAPPASGFWGNLIGLGSSEATARIDDLRIDMLPPTPFDGAVVGSPRAQLALQR